MFAIHLDQSLRPQDHPKIVEQHDEWRDLLPRFDDEKVFALSVLSPGVPFPNPSPPPVRFRRVAPDGETEGELLVHENRISTTWTTYVSWDQAWGTARTLFQSVITRLDTAQLRLQAAELQYLDTFAMTGTPTPDDFRGLLNQESDHLPGNLFDQGPLWHLHRGRFRDPPSTQPSASQLLERMHINCARDSDRYLVHLDNFHRIDWSAGPPLDSVFSGPDAPIDAYFDRLHESAKVLLRSYLTPQISGRISLDA